MNESSIRKHSKKGMRIPKEARAILEEWVRLPERHPFPPSHQDQEMLAHRTGLTELQVRNWLRRYHSIHSAKNSMISEEIASDDEKQVSSNYNNRLTPSEHMHRIAQIEQRFAFPKSSFQRKIFRVLAHDGLPRERRQLCKAIEATNWTYFLTCLKQMREKHILKAKPAHRTSLEMIELTDECNPFSDKKQAEADEPRDEPRDEPPSPPPPTIITTRTRTLPKLNPLASCQRKRKRLSSSSDELLFPESLPKKSSSPDELFQKSLEDGIRLATRTNHHHQNKNADYNILSPECQLFSSSKIEELLQLQRAEILGGMAPKPNACAKSPSSEPPFDPTQTHPTLQLQHNFQTNPLYSLFYPFINLH